MANFRQHLYYGLGTSAVGALVAYQYLGLTPVQACAAYIIGVMASLAPDIDLPQSVPGELLFNCLGILVPLGVYFYVPVKYTSTFHLEHWLVTLVVGYVFVKYVVTGIFDRMTIHRGMFHSIPAVLICGEIAFLLFAHLPIKARLAFAGIAILGYLTHLAADEMYSVDWSGKEIKTKKSLGSALDIGRFNELSTWCAYGIAGSLGYLIWQQVGTTMLR